MTATIERVRKVKKALGLYVSKTEVEWPCRGCAVAWQGGYSAEMVIRLSDGHWTFGSAREGISGIVGGFNTNALGVLDALAALRYFSEKDAAAFHDWWHAEDERMERGSAEQRMRETAAKLGFEIRPRRKGESR